MQRPRNRSEDLEDLLRRERMGMCRGKVRRLGRLARGMLTPTGQRSNCGSIPCSQNVARYYFCSASLGSFWLHCDTGGRRRWLICQRAVSVSRNYEPGVVSSNPVGRANSFKGLIERSTTPCRLEGTFPITLVGGCPLPTQSGHSHVRAEPVFPRPCDGRSLPSNSLLGKARGISTSTESHISGYAAFAPLRQLDDFIWD